MSYTDKINARKLKCVSKQMYIKCLKAHLKGVNLADVDAVVAHIANKSVPIKIMCLKIGFHVTEDKRYRQLVINENEKYKSNLLKREHKVIDWPAIIKRTYATRNNSQESFIAFLLTILLSTHPRRFQDYCLLDLENHETSNWYDGKKIHFRVYKTADSMTGGDRVVVLNPKVRDWLEIYIKKFNITGRFFTMKPRRFRYIFEKYDLPRATESRRHGERTDIANGMSHVDASKKYNHSISTQLVSYLMRPE